MAPMVTTADGDPWAVLCVKYIPKFSDTHLVHVQIMFSKHGQELCSLPGGTMLNPLLLELALCQ